MNWFYSVFCREESQFTPKSSDLVMLIWAISSLKICVNVYWKKHFITVCVGVVSWLTVVFSLVFEPTLVCWAGESVTRALVIDLAQGKRCVWDRVCLWCIVLLCSFRCPPWTRLKLFIGWYSIYGSDQISVCFGRENRAI